MYREKIGEESAGRSFSKPFFRIRENRTKFLSSFYLISLAQKIAIVSVSANHNPELPCVICTGVTLELHCFQPVRID